MPIDWDAAKAQAEQRDQEIRDQAAALARAQREAYLADRERIAREQPEAIDIALRLLKCKDESLHQKIKDAAEQADLVTLRQWRDNLRFTQSRSHLG